MSSIKGRPVTSFIDNEYLIQEKQFKVAYFIDEEEAEDEQPIACAWFGCGKKLNHREQLCGKYCIEHIDTKPLDVTRVLKFK